MEPLSNFNSAMYLGSPAVTNAAASDTTGLGWLAKFMEACDGCTIDFINIHWYVPPSSQNYQSFQTHSYSHNPHRYNSIPNSAQNFKDHIANARKVAKGLPIWVTEFRAEGTDDEIRAFLDDVMPWMDNSQDIHRYAYFMARPGKGMLVNDAGDGLSDIGKEFAFFHKHDSEKDRKGKSYGKGWDESRYWEEDK